MILNNNQPPSKYRLYGVDLERMRELRQQMQPKEMAAYLDKPVDWIYKVVATNKLTPEKEPKEKADKKRQSLRIQVFGDVRLVNDKGMIFYTYPFGDKRILRKRLDQAKREHANKINSREWEISILTDFRYL